MSNWWTLQLCWGLPCRGCCAWWDSIVTQTLMMTFLRGDVTCTLMVTSHNDGFRRLLAWLTKGISNPGRVGICLINAALDIRQSNDLTPLWHQKREDSTLWHNWSLALPLLEKHFGHYKNIAVITSSTLSPFSSCKILIWDSQNYTATALVFKTSGHLTWYAKIFFVVWERSANDFVNLTSS